ncbi:hypothetical protein ASE75_05285 [Sphingomonas sp. Leaf17]|uniref:M67 family metallopeptidase n=1 Tax=Sphingomonas sp. Leaf17 TaxID=1735683 RepID=UPI0006F8A9A9|nr:M67 family metallopeptidase [Sphingomonas sp. Leaf17]KQM65658.1 hypothetical protein ASE75_05285 [Sphingomonas sp. Leaf17]
MDVTISSSALSAILADAAGSPMVEVCGLLLGDGQAIRLARACRNVAADPARRFEVDPAALLAAHRLARSGGERVLGHYHSHPSGRAVPSPRDAADGVPDGSLWLIVADGDARMWRAVAEGPIEGRFAPVAFTTLPCADSSSRPEEPDS